MELPILKDSGVRFDVAEHRYWLGDTELYGITSTLVNRAYPDTYKDIPADVLQKAAERGTNIHQAIQFCEENGLDSEMNEYVSYKSMKDWNGLTYVTNEYIVTDGKRYASAIDLVFVNADGEIIIADIKTTYKPHYDNVALQLSIYKRFFEMQNPDLKVSKCVLIWLRDEKSEYREMPVWADEMLDALIKSDIEGSPFDVQSIYGSLPQRFADVEEEVARLEIAVKVAQERQKELRQGLYEDMEKANMKSWSGSKVKLTRILPTMSETFDTKSFKAAHPDLYNQFVKKSERAGSLKITLVK